MNSFIQQALYEWVYGDKKKAIRLFNMERRWSGVRKIATQADHGRAIYFFIERTGVGYHVKDSQEVQG